jgi:hypothetical protein
MWKQHDRAEETKHKRGMKRGSKPAHAASPRQSSSPRLRRASYCPPSDMDVDDREIMLDCCKVSMSRGTEAPPPPWPTSPPLHSIRASSIVRRRLADA